MRNEQPRTVRQAADEMGLSPATIRAWIGKRKLGHIRLGRAVRIPASEIQRIVEHGTVSAIREGRG